MKIYFEEISSFAEDESSRSPIIFMHGLVFSSKTWKRCAPIIAKKTGRKAYLLDARNHGKSQWSDEMNFDLLTADLTEFMNEHGIKRAVIVGNSMGGRTAINFALKHPQRVEILIVEEMTPRNLKSNSFLGNVVPFILQLLASFPQELELDELKRKAADEFMNFFHPLYIDKEKMNKHLELEMIPIVKDGGVLRLESNINAIASALESNFLVQDLPQSNLVFSGTVMFIYGSKGFFNLEKDKTVKTLFPNAVIKRIEGGCHCSHVDSPDEYAEIVSEFILLDTNHSSKY